MARERQHVSSSMTTFPVVTMSNITAITPLTTTTTPNTTDNTSTIVTQDNNGSRNNSNSNSNRREENAISSSSNISENKISKRPSLLRRWSRAIITAAVAHRRRRLSDPNRLRGSLKSHIDRSDLNGNVDNPVPESIQFFQMDIGDDRLLKIANYVRCNQVVKTINLSHNAFGQDGVFALAMALQADQNVVERLTLCGNPDMGLSGICALAQALPHCSHLRALNLSQNRLGNAGCKALAHALAKPTTQLQELLLHSNRIGPEGASFLATALAQNQNVHSLDVSDNVMGDEGLSALAEGLRTNTTLRRLYVVENRYSTVGVQALLTLVQDSNTTLIAVNARLGQEPTMKQSTLLQQLSYFLSLNQHGRAWMRSDQPNPALLPFVLQSLTTSIISRKNNNNSTTSSSFVFMTRSDTDSNMPLVYGILRELPHVWSCYAAR